MDIYRKSLNSQYLIDNPNLMMPFLVHDLLRAVVAESPADLYFDPMLKPSEMRLYREIIASADYRRDIDNESYPCSKTKDKVFAEKLKVSIDSVQDALRGLKNKGYVVTQLVLTPEGNKREIIIKNWTGGDQFIAITFAHYPEYVQLELVMQAYRKRFNVQEPESTEELRKLKAILEDINGHGLLKWIDRYDKIYNTVAPITHRYIKIAA